MFDRAPGPLERLDEDVLQRFPVAPSFEGLVAGALEGLRGSDDALGGAARDTAGDGTPDLDAAYASTVGVSEDVLNGQVGGADDHVADALVDKTAGADAYRATVLPHLPQPDAPIEGDFTDPPKPPGLGGGDDGGDDGRHRD